MKLIYNEQILKVTESEIRKFNDYARNNEAKYYLTLGEPDFYTPESIVEATKKAMDDHKTKYGPTPGNLSLRKKICEFEKKINNVDESRAKYYDFYTGQKWGARQNYNVCINTTGMDIKKLAEDYSHMLK